MLLAVVIWSTVNWWNKMFMDILFCYVLLCLVHFSFSSSTHSYLFVSFLSACKSMMLIYSFVKFVLSNWSEDPGRCKGKSDFLFRIHFLFALRISVVIIYFHLLNTAS